MRARWTKPEDFRSRKLAALGPVAFLVLKALECMADDGGVAPCDADRVKGELFYAWSEVGVPECSRSIQALVQADVIRPYVATDGDTYCEIVGFEPDKVHKPSKFRYPRDRQEVSGQCGTSEALVRHSSNGSHHLDTKTPRHQDTQTPNTSPDGDVGAGAPSTPRIVIGADDVDPPRPEPSLESPHSNGSGAPGSTPGVALVVAEKPLPVLGGGKRGEPKTLAVIEAGIASVMADVAAGRRKALHAEELLRVKAGIWFAYWAQMTGRPPSSPLDSDRAARIRGMLKLARESPVGDLGMLLYAVDGLLKDDFRMGRTPRSSRKQDRVDDVLKNYDTVEELARSVGACRRNEPHPIAVKYLALSQAPDEVAHAARN